MILNKWYMLEFFDLHLVKIFVPLIIQFDLICEEAINRKWRPTLQVSKRPWTLSALKIKHLFQIYDRSIADKENNEAVPKTANLATKHIFPEKRIKKSVSK